MIARILASTKMELTPAVAPATEEVDPFVGRTYRVLFAALAGIALLGIASYRWLPGGWVIPLGTADSILWVLCGWFSWRRPVVVVFPIFSVVTGLFLGQLAHSSPDAFLYAAILTLISFGGLTVYVHFTKRDFSFLRGFLCVAFFILLVGGCIVPFSHSHREHVAYAAFGTFVFLCWILYDTGQITENAEEELTPGVAAFELLLDIIALHDWMIDLLKETMGRSSEE